MEYTHPHAIPKSARNKTLLNLSLSQRPPTTCHPEAGQSGAERPAHVYGACSAPDVSPACLAIDTRMPTHGMPACRRSIKRKFSHASIYEGVISNARIVPTTDVCYGMTLGPGAHGTRLRKSHRSLPVGALGTRHIDA
jgi:hypothetical protein